MFNEDNTIDAIAYKQSPENGWEYVPASELPREMSDVMVESWVKDALLRLNPTITQNRQMRLFLKLEQSLYPFNHTILLQPMRGLMNWFSIKTPIRLEKTANTSLSVYLPKTT